MAEQNKDRVVRIAESNMPRLENEIAKLNRRADKIDCPHISLTIHSTEMARDPTIVARLLEYYAQSARPIPTDQLENIPLVKMHTVEIIGEGPKVDGWKFAGTLDHYTIPGKVIVNTVPGETVPERYFEADSTCDHCEKSRRRVETFVLEGIDENEGEWMLVGRNCLKDFFGHDPMYVARWLNRLSHFVESLEEDEWSRGSGGRYEHYYNSLTVLTTTVACIRSFGWVAKSSAKEGQSPTSGDVEYALSSPSSAKERDAWEKFIASIKFDKAADLKEAEEAVAWLKEQEASNEYMHNLKLLEDETHFPAKMIGYWCSLISAYQRTQARLEYAKSTQKLNEHFGTEGERTEVRVKCTGLSYTQSDYGVITIHRMLTEAGHTLVWFANADAKMAVNNEYNIRTGIKKHGEYKNWKQTILSRVHVIEEIEAEEVS